MDNTNDHSTPTAGKNSKHEHGALLREPAQQDPAPPAISPGISATDAGNPARREAAETDQAADAVQTVVATPNERVKRRILRDSSMKEEREGDPEEYDGDRKWAGLHYRVMPRTIEQYEWMHCQIGRVVVEKRVAQYPPEGVFNLLGYGRTMPEAEEMVERKLGKVR
jgi:hypothetical protein